jgi:hypothetical protein
VGDKFLAGTRGQAIRKTGKHGNRKKRAGISTN